MNSKHTVKDYLLLYAAFGIFSGNSIMGKLASGYPMLSLPFLCFYGAGIGFLLVYAVIWQKLLKRFELTVAYSNKPIVTLLGMVWGVVLFHEPLTWNMILGAAVILFGIWLVVASHE